MNKKIEIPFGAKDSELKGWEYTIPEDMEAEIKDGKIIVKQKESEDERIRKKIISIIEQYGRICEKEGDPCLELNDCLAYLEKHTESTWTEEDESFMKCTLPRILEPDNWTLEQNEGDKERLKEFISRQKNKYIERQKEQKPVSGSSEKPNNHKEWSEEDEEYLNFFIDIAESLIDDEDYGDMTYEEHKEFYKKRISWLKSLRPQSNTVSVENATKFGDLEYERGVKDGIQSEKSRQWKPSEEQMDALNEIINTLAASKHPHESDYLFNILNGLRKSLKKL